MKNLSIVIIVFLSIFLADCTNTFHSSYINYSSEISNNCLTVKINVDNPKFSWKINGEKENVNIQATFYNNCSEEILIRNPFIYGKDGRFSVIDSSGTELEKSWIDVFRRNEKDSLLICKDSLTIPIIFPILYDYSLQNYGKYKIYLTYWGFFIKRYSQFEVWGDSVLVSETYKRLQNFTVISDTVEIQYME